jgi:major capsid protein E
MASMDIFNDNAFGLIELTAALEDIEYQPNWLGSLGLFTEQNVRTSSVAIEKRSNELHLVPVTERGAALPQLTGGRRDIRNFNTVRVAKGDRLNASEIANIRAFGSETEMEQVQTEVAERMTRIRNDIDLTHEHMRLGTIQGFLLDSDGTVIQDWFSAWGISQPAEMVFNFATLIDGKLRQKSTQIIRTMRKAAKGAWGPGTQVYALCGDEFWDALIMAPEVRATYLGWSAAADLRQEVQDYTVFPFGGINWVNYQGTDDGSTVAIEATKVKFFPVNAPGAFIRANSPGESFEVINTPGQQFYALTVPDRDRNMWVDIEVYSYPLYIPTRPAMLQRGRLA